MASLIRSIGFDGYRSFPSRRQYDRKQPLNSLVLAPLTLLIGRNNAGKSSIAALLHQVLAGLAATEGTALPLSVGGLPIADGFQDLLHARDANTFLELDIEIDTPTEQHHLNTILYLHSLLDDDTRPWARAIQWNGEPCAIEEAPLDEGLLPNIPQRAELQAEAGRVLRSSVWLGPLRAQIPETPSQPERSSRGPKIGPAGEGVVRLLADDEELFSMVSDWLKKHAGFSLRWEKNLDIWLLKVVRGDTRSLSIAQVGAGVHQLLPVLALALWRQRSGGEDGYLDVVQQPELHLHDALQPALGDLFVDAALKRRGLIVVETHAEGLLLRVRRRIAEGRISPEQVALYYVDDAPSGSQLRRIGLLANGEVDYWPEGVFLESFEEVKELRRAQRRAG
jgi:predicted ATPase